MISIERLFELLSPRGVAIGAAVGGKGVFSKEDAMGVVAQVQGKYLVGVKVLEASICGDIDAENLLINALAKQYETDFRPVAASALAKLAVNEVCGTRICTKCHGTKLNYHRNGECLHCCGTGKMLNTVEQLTKSFCDLSGTKITAEQFSQHFYDKYMTGVDTLHHHQADAERHAKRVLRLVAAENEQVN
nr:TIGR02642 family protein [uncultured Shewanella sp.]